MMNALLVGLGGAIGAMTRYGVNVLCACTVGMGFPYNTVIINVLGSLAMGLLVGYFATHEPISMSMKLFLTTGILGGFTTFSAFSLESVLLYDRRPDLAAIYIATSVILSIAACALGMRLVR